MLATAARNAAYSVPFVLGTPGRRGIGLDRHPQRPGRRFENRFGDVVAVSPVMHDDVQVAQSIGGESVPEVGDQFGVEIADLVRREVGLEDEIRPAAEVQARPCRASPPSEA